MSDVVNEGWFHGILDDEMIKLVLSSYDRISYIHPTASLSYYSL